MTKIQFELLLYFKGISQFIESLEIHLCRRLCGPDYYSFIDYSFYRIGVSYDWTKKKKKEKKTREKFKETWSQLTLILDVNLTEVI